MEYISTTTFWQVISGLTAIMGLLVGYWIKEIKGVEKSLDTHIIEADRADSDSQRANDTVHAELRLSIKEAEGRNNTKIAEIIGKIGEMNVKLDYIIKTIEKQ